MSASSDAVMKLVSSGVLPVDSDVTLEMLGFDKTTIERVRSDRRRAQGASLIESLTRAPVAAPASPTPVEADAGVV